MSQNICPICQYDGLYQAPYDEYGVGSYEICPCCGFQFGYDDFPEKEKQIDEWRNQWIAKGKTWFSDSRKPPVDWNFKK